MVPRLRWAGGAAAVVLVASVAGTVAPASAQTSSSTSPTTAPATAAPAARSAVPATFDGLCWMGATRPIFRIRNTDPARRLDYTVRSGTAMRSGALAPGTGPNSTAYVVGSGTFPKVSPTRLTWTTPEESGTVDGPQMPATYCTYDVTPAIRWRDAEGAPLPAPAAAAGLVLTMSGPLEQLFCGWRAQALDCTQQALAGSPLPPGSYPTSGAQLQLPTFASRGSAPTYDVKVTAPDGFTLAGGTGTFSLDDVGAGLGQANVDRRMTTLLESGRRRTHTVTLQQIARPAPPVTTAPAAPASSPSPVVAGGQQVPPVTTAPAAAPTTTAPPPTVAASPAVATPDPSTPLPRTGPVAPGITVGGAVLALVGLGLLILGRRRTSQRDVR